MARYDPDWVASMLDPARERETDPPGLLAACGLAEGATVVDYGAGPGFFTLPAARLVGPGGRVVAVDLEPRMREAVLRRAGEAGLTWVEAIGPEDAGQLPAGLARLVIAALFLHDLAPDERDAVLPELRRLVAPGGRLLVVEWVPPSGVGGPSTPNRMSAADLGDLLRRHGLRPGWMRRLGEPYYALVARP